MLRSGRHAALRPVPARFAQLQARFRMSPVHCCISCHAADRRLATPHRDASLAGQARSEAMQSNPRSILGALVATAANIPAGTHLLWPSVVLVLLRVENPCPNEPAKAEPKDDHLTSAPLRFSVIVQLLWQIRTKQSGLAIRGEMGTAAFQHEPPVQRRGLA
jgi:hypothetical protein